MFSHYLKIAYRNMIKFKSHTFINVFGLSVGICASLLILLYLFSEFSYDEFQANKENIYRISIVGERNGEVEGESHIFVPAVGPDIKSEIPEVEQYFRMSTTRLKYFYHNNKAYMVNEVSYADSTMLDLFSFTLAVGNKDKFLNEPYTVALTKNTATKIFGNGNALGEVVIIDDKPYKVTGILEDLPYNSHIQFDALISFETLYHEPNNYMGWNGGNQYLTYIKLVNSASLGNTKKKLPGFMWKHINEELSQINVVYKAQLQPFDEIHLYFNPYSKSLMANIFIYSAVAVLILIIACVNFINLTLARSMNRRKEVGIRKVIGANKPLIVEQFLSETLLLSFIALCVGLLLAKLIYPVYMKLLNAEFEFVDFVNPAHLLFLFGIVVLVGIISGIYPALYLGSTSIVQNLRKFRGKNRVNMKSRNPLVVVQFTIAIALIISTIFIQSQINFVQNKDVGFAKENVVVIPLMTNEAREKCDVLRNEFKKLPGISMVSASSKVPYNGFEMNGYFPEGYQSPVMINVVDVDEDFLNFYDLKLIKGKNFSRELATDDTTFLVNEALAKSLNWENPLGKSIRRNGEHKIIGVVKDFHYASMHNKIEPLIITNKPWNNQFRNISVKINSADISGSINSIKNITLKIIPASVFDYYFLEDAMGTLYNREKRFKDLFLYFSSLAIVLALLGLFSLTSLSIEQRVKEIGIRKVLGASSPSIVKLFSKEIITLVVIAALIASPMSYYFIKKWLDNFAYTIDVNLWVFIIASVSVIMLAFSAITYQTVKAALSNPINSLRYE